jgi:putative redox protein
VTDPPPPIALELRWQGQRRFAGRAGAVTLALDTAGGSDPTPVQALAFALAGCMAMDVLHVLTRGRLAVGGLRVALTGERVAEEPRRFAGFRLHFEVTGDVPPDRVERAIALSRDRHCSVWHSLRRDIALETSFAVIPPEPAPAA